MRRQMTEDGSELPSSDFGLPTSIPPVSSLTVQDGSLAGYCPASLGSEYILLYSRCSTSRRITTILINLKDVLTVG